ncbi:MAG: winged helix-turn-helix domain-containing protein [Acetobacteraceae bacterium]|nr:winged helix-turn-helix domain-containing protein [Acetobacteraceae bacterium]
MDTPADRQSSRPPTERPALRFAGFVLDPTRGSLLGPDGAEVPLRPKSLDVLRHLAGNAGRLVPRDELMAAAWPDAVVSDDSITQCVAEVRRALGDEAQRLLRTVPKRGYLFAAEVARGGPPPIAEARQPAVPCATSPVPLRARSLAKERRLTAILVADVAGYSRFVGLDEAGTLERLQALRGEVLEPLVARYGGRVVNYAGDGALAEFPSLVRAVECALAVQRAVAEREPEAPPDRRLALRIGVHAGDVVADAAGDVYGDAVNVAARLEQLAAPGGICLSDRAHEEVARRVDAAFEYRGEPPLKNIARAVGVWAWPPGDRHGRAAAEREGAVLASLPPMAREPRLSVVVLPFANLNRDPEQDYLADGVTEDLTSELSRLPDFFVIARSTAFTFKGASADIKRIARELGVRYAVEGSVRREGQRVRVTAQLIDAETAAHVWGDRFDRELSGIFELQETIALELANALGARLVEVESRRSEASPDPGLVDLLMRARAAFNSRASSESRAAAERLYEEAVQCSPDDVGALTGLAVTLASKVSDQYSTAPYDDLRRAEALAVRVVGLDRENPWCHYALGVVRRLQSRFDEALNHLEAALRLNPCMNAAHAQIGWVKTFSGRAEEAWPHFAECIRLSPRDPRLFLGFFGFGWTRFLLKDDDGAVEMLRRAIALNADYPPCHLGLAAAYGMSGRVDEARAALAAYLRTGTPTVTIALLRARSFSKHPVWLAQRERLYEGLRRAGMPEE